MYSLVQKRRIQLLQTSNWTVTKNSPIKDIIIPFVIETLASLCGWDSWFSSLTLKTKKKFLSNFGICILWKLLTRPFYCHLDIISLTFALIRDMKILLSHVIFKRAKCNAFLSVSHNRSHPVYFNVFNKKFNKYSHGFVNIYWFIRTFHNRI